MVAIPAGPPPPSVPEGWKAHWNADYKAWFYENIYTEESTWEKPTEPVYPPQARTPLPPGPPPGYTPAVQQNTEEVKSADPATLPNPMAAMALSDGNHSYSQSPAQQPAYGYAPQPQQTAQQPASQGPYTATPPLAQSYPAQPTIQGATPATEVRDYNGEPQRQQQALQQPVYGYAPQPQDQRGPQLGYQQQQGYPPQQPGYPPQQQPGYPPQQPGYPPQQPGYPPQQPGYPPQQQLQQPGYPQQQLAQPQGAPQKAPGGGFMNMLNSKVGNKVPGGAGTLLGVGAGLLAGGVLAHEWDEHEEREKRGHHGFGGLGGLMKGFGGPPVVENITVNTDYETNDTFNF